MSDKAAIPGRAQNIQADIFEMLNRPLIPHRPADSRNSRPSKRVFQAIAVEALFPLYSFVPDREQEENPELYDRKAIH
ncbi:MULTISPECIES: hypothetical protein [Allobaculum]|uniref:hypothetical protein n=1 Tax=Allobaculum TaxID=174708 RepID=UPI001E2F7D74|nr:MULTISPECIES: hypothetical protein [Allobaculum]UNT92423.1 hypothetical protein KWG61_09590 [Allobaculum sp. Allo2]